MNPYESSYYSQQLAGTSRSNDRNYGAARYTPSYNAGRQANDLYNRGFDDAALSNDLAQDITSYILIQKSYSPLRLTEKDTTVLSQVTKWSLPINFLNADATNSREYINRIERALKLMPSLKEINLANFRVTAHNAGYLQSKLTGIYGQVMSDVKSVTLRTADRSVISKVFTTPYGSRMFPELKTIHLKYAGARDFIDVARKVASDADLGLNDVRDGSNYIPGTSGNNFGVSMQIEMVLE